MGTTPSRHGRVGALVIMKTPSTQSSSSFSTLSQHPNFSSLTLSNSFSMCTWMEVGSELPSTDNNSSSEMK